QERDVVAVERHRDALAAFDRDPADPTPDEHGAIAREPVTALVERRVVDRPETQPYAVEAVGRRRQPSQPVELDLGGEPEAEGRVVRHASAPRSRSRPPVRCGSTTVA